jgi:hypothetical protein
VKSSFYIILLFLARKSLRIQRSSGAPIVFYFSFPLELLLAEHQVGKGGQLQGMLLLF